MEEYVTKLKLNVSAAGTGGVTQTPAGHAVTLAEAPEQERALGAKGTADGHGPS